MSTTPGYHKGQEAYKSELSGILHTIMIVEIISNGNNILEGEMMAACDGLEATIM